MVKERLHRIKKKDRRRPLTVRALAVFMALAMVLSVIYVNNRGSRVEAGEVDYSDTTYLSSIMTDLDTVGGAYTVYAPAKGITFTLPDAPSTDETTSTMDLYNIVEEGETRYYLEEKEGSGITSGVSKTITTSYAWDMAATITSPQSGHDVTANLKQTIDTLVTFPDLGGGDRYFKYNSAGYYVEVTTEAEAKETSTIDSFASVTVETFDPVDISSFTVDNTNKTVSITDSDEANYTTDQS